MVRISKVDWLNKRQKKQKIQIKKHCGGAKYEY